MKSVIKFVYFIFALFVLSCSSNASDVTPAPIPNIPTSDDFIRAADMSYLPLIESEGTIFKKNGVAENALTTLKNAGCNTIRIRIWKNPSDNHSGLAEVKTLALRVKQAGMKVWLTVHYSDTWADPGNQTPPSDWTSLSFANLKTAVSTYTTLLMTEIQPDIIQIGNEINSGFIWPQGHLINNESQCLQLISAASTAIRNQSATTKIMIHYAGIGSGATWFFNKMSSINYDYIGLSYYPVWHGKILSDVNATITSLGETHNKKVIIAETAYPFTLGYNDYTNNILGLADQLVPTYPATNQGQKEFLLAIKNLVKQNSRGLGFCYWGAEWLAFRGPTATNGSSWENQALWDFNNNALPVMDAFSQN
jgi:arabinogalactan endo-1,4-beta-galactosidase